MTVACKSLPDQLDSMGQCEWYWLAIGIVCDNCTVADGLVVTATTELSAPPHSFICKCYSELFVIGFDARWSRSTVVLSPSGRIFAFLSRVTRVMLLFCRLIRIVYSIRFNLHTNKEHENKLPAFHRSVDL